MSLFRKTNFWSFDRSQSEQFPDFVLVQEQFARGLGRVIELVAVGELVNVDVVQPDLVLVHPGKAVTDLNLAGANGFYLGAVQDDARLESVEDVIIPPGLGVGHDVGHKKISQKVEPSGWGKQTTKRA